MYLTHPALFYILMFFGTLSVIISGTIFKSLNRSYFSMDVFGLILAILPGLLSVLCIVISGFLAMYSIDSVLSAIVVIPATFICATASAGIMFFGILDKDNEAITKLTNRAFYPAAIILVGIVYI